MPRRVNLPSADDLFRPTVRAVPDQPDAEEPPAADTKPAGRPKPSGRIRHDEKMTVYVTSEELMHLEQARITLRGVHGMAVDRGRLVREAIDMVLEDFEANGEQSILVRRLSQD